MNATRYQRFEVLITQELKALSDEDARGADSQSVVTLDQQSVGRLSRVDALQAQAMAKAAQQRRDQRRQALLAALQRLRENEFGYCQDCGEDISEKRLNFDPSALRCISCAKG